MKKKKESIIIPYNICKKSNYAIVTNEQTVSRNKFHMSVPTTNQTKIDYSGEMRTNFRLLMCMCAIVLGGDR